ncbi:SCO7613 C-terminal domain-containing membrane protein [Streptomyces rhizoryzae]|uniref:SCO7613 C-terminal domain-containing membrane protein n=1 Tax=Streptomyces rhizoryzae TaxID=2932493 RepID=UPI00249DBE3F|nr:hypothetical protein [Streptomyces rhizoryzae]
MSGPDAAALWQVTVELSGLEARRQWLVQRRAELLAGLRARRDAPAGVPGAVPGDVLSWPAAPRQGGGTAGAGREVSALSARTALLIVGGALVVMAALVFTVVSWGRLGIGGRAAVLFALTVCALALPRPLLRRRLAATAEASAAVGLALVLLDAFAARQAGLGGLDRVGAVGYWAVLTALTAVGSAVYGGWQRLRFPLPAGFLLARLPGLLGAAAWGGKLEDYATAATATAVVDFAVLHALAAGAARHAGFRERLGGDKAVAALVTGGRAAAAGWALLGGMLAVGCAVGATSLPEVMRAWVPLGLLALLGAGLGRGVRGLPFALRSGGAGVAVVAVVVGVGAGLRHVVPWGWAPAGYAAPAALIAMGAAVSCARHGRWAEPAVVGPPGTPAGGPSSGAPVNGPAGLSADGPARLPADGASEVPAGGPAGVPAGGPAGPPVGGPSGTAGEKPSGPPPEAAAAVGGLAAASAALALCGAAVLPNLAYAVLRPVIAGAELWVSGHRAPWHWQFAPAPLTVLWLSAAVLAVMAVLRARTAAGGGRTDRLADVLRSASVLAAVPALLLLPVAVGLPYEGVLAVAAAGVVAMVVDLVRRPGAALAWRLVVLSAAGAPALLWSLADRPATLTVWGVLAGLAAVLAHVLSAPTARTAQRAIAPVAGAFAVLALGGEAVAGAVTAGLPRHVTAFAVLAVALTSACAAAAWHRGAGREQLSVTVEGGGYAVAAIALALTADHPGSLSLALAVAGVAGLAIALRPDRRRALLAGIALLIASSWVRLALAGVSSPEAYTLPVTAAALVIGHRHRSRDPEVGSWPAYGSGLCATMLPSLAATWNDQHGARPLLLGTAALLATVVGVRTRLQAPLVIGGFVLVLVGLHELAPTVVQALGLLPRWVPLAAAGLLLLLLGATYERRWEQARRLRDTVRGMR